MNRRNFIGSILAAPAIVRAEILMPVTKIWTLDSKAFPTSQHDLNLFWRRMVDQAPFGQRSEWISTRMNRLWMERINRI